MKDDAEAPSARFILHPSALILSAAGQATLPNLQFTHLSYFDEP
jgi:hypothetical protein